MTLLDSLNWRYAVKKFDNTKKINADDLKTLKEAVRLSASSYGLQPYKVLVIEDPKVKEQLLPASWGQQQIVDASQIFVFCNYLEVKPTEVDHLLERTAKTNNLQINDLVGYGDFMKSKISSLSEDAVKVWTAKQTYIGLANLLAAAGELKIDTCPMEGFDAEQYSEILGLEEKGLAASVVATVGYRSSDDTHQFGKKVRKSLEELVETI